MQETLDAAWKKFTQLSRKGLALTALPPPDGQSEF